MNAWMTCSICGGHGLVTNTFNGEPDDCRDCGGSGVERARDSMGRYCKQEGQADEQREPSKASHTGIQLRETT